jgi:hypothetical protein
MWGRYWLHLSDLTNQKETPRFSPAVPHIRSGLLDPTSFQKLRFCKYVPVSHEVRLNTMYWKAYDLPLFQWTFFF